MFQTRVRTCPREQGAALQLWLPQEGARRHQRRESGLQRNPRGSPEHWEPAWEQLCQTRGQVRIQALDLLGRKEWEYGGGSQTIKAQAGLGP